MRSKVVFLILTILVLSSIEAFAAPLFGDVPDSHWARDAVANLAAKGLVEGYPDGTFKGDRAATRYELAMVIARFLAKNDQEHATFATKADLEELRKLVSEYLDELEAIGVRVTNLEEQCGRLDKRVTELERIRFYGSFESVWVAQSVGGDLPLVGTLLNPGIDWSTGRLLTSGTGLSALARLGVQASIAPEIDAGSEFAAYTSMGDPVVDQYWGVAPPYLSNPFLAAGTPAIMGDVQGLNNRPWTRMVLDNFWTIHKPSRTKVVCGAFTPELIDRSILAGPKNPNIHSPEFLPFYGAKVSSYKEGRLLSWEAATSRLPQDSNGPTNYNTWMAAANMAFNFDRGKISLDFLRAVNEMNSFGGIQGVGIIPIPLARSWVDSRTNLLRNFVGPQSQNSFAFKGEYKFSPEVRFEGELASTEYNPDTSGINFSTTSSGSLARAGLFCTFKERLKLNLSYVSVSATYDPFLLQYQIPPAFPVLLPYATYYSNYWQLHDSYMYPSNRQGLAFNGSYRWENTEFSANWGSLEQVAASTPGQMQTPGNVEPLFPTLQGGGTEKGKVNNWGVGLSHTFPCKLNAFLQYYNYGILRSSGFALDDMNVSENLCTAGLSIPVGRKMTLFGNYTVFGLKGNVGLFDQDYRQDIPAIGAGYKFSEGSDIKMSYRLFYLKNYAIAGSDWRAHQTMMEYKMSF